MNRVTMLLLWLIVTGIGNGVNELIVSTFIKGPLNTVEAVIFPTEILAASKIWVSIVPVQSKKPVDIST